MEMWTTALVVVTCGLNIAGLAINAFFKGYGEKKGENLATKEDLQDVVEQVKVVTRTTEEIKTELSEKSWSKQRHWDMKRDTALEIMRAYSAILEKALFVFEAQLKGDRAAEGGDAVRMNEMREQHETAKRQYSNETTVFWQLKDISRLVFQNKIYLKMNEIKDTFEKLMDEMSTCDDAKTLSVLFFELEKKRDELAEAMRSELGL